MLFQKKWKYKKISHGEKCLLYGVNIFDHC